LTKIGYFINDNWKIGLSTCVYCLSVLNYLKTPKELTVLVNFTIYSYDRFVTYLTKIWYFINENWKLG